MTGITNADWKRFQQDMNAGVRELREGYATLLGMTGRAKGVPTERPTRDINPPIPIAVDVVDLIADVDRAVDHLVRLARGTMRLGVTPRRAKSRAAATDAGMKFLADGIRHVWAADPVLGERIVDDLWTLRRKVRNRVGGGGPRPYRTAAPCKACGAGHVMVHPTRRSAKCVACGAAQ